MGKIENQCKTFPRIESVVKVSVQKKQQQGETTTLWLQQLPHKELIGWAEGPGMWGQSVSLLTWCG